jgi:hypothetical protein
MSIIGNEKFKKLRDEIRKGNKLNEDENKR